MVYEDFKNLPRITAADKVLRVKDLILLEIQVMMDIYKKSSGSGVKSKIMSNQELVEESHRPIV